MSINIIQKAFTTNRKESVSRHDTSPVKTVLGKRSDIYLNKMCTLGSLNAPQAADASSNNRNNFVLNKKHLLHELKALYPIFFVTFLLEWPG